MVKEKVFSHKSGLKSIEIDQNKPEVYECIAVSYAQLFYKTKDAKFLNLRIENLKKAMKIEPKNGSVLGEIANTYAYFQQKDSLIKYITKADEVDSKFVNAEVRKLIKKK